MERINPKNQSIQSNDYKIQALSETHIDHAVNTVNRAFINYPLTEHFFGNFSYSKRLNLYHSSYIIKSALTYGSAIYSGDNIKAVLTGFHSEEYNLTNWKMIKAGCLMLPFKIGLKALSRIKAYNAFSSRIRRRSAPHKHWFLTMLAVEPAYQKNGYGQALMHFMNQALDKINLSSYLETHTKANVKFYEKFGYKLVEENTVPDSILNLYSMLRLKK